MTAVLTTPHPNVLAEQISGRDYLSFSAVSLYQRCPLAYRFKYIDGLPELVVSSSLLFGSGVHASIEYHFNELMAGNPAPDQDTLLSVFWDSWQRRSEDAQISFAKGEDVNDIGSLADRVLAAFGASDLAEPQGAILGVEESLRGQVVPDAPDVLARIDLLVESEDVLTVTDFKTARSRWSDAQAEEQGEQLLLYSELVRQLAPGKNVRLEFAVLSKTKSPVAQRHAVTVDAPRILRTKQIVSYVWNAIESGHFYPAPSPINCPSCPFREPCAEWAG